MKLLILGVAFSLSCSSALAGWSYYTVNGETYTVWDNGSNWIDVTGPNGYHATGWRWGNGNIDWTVTGGYRRPR